MVISCVRMRDYPTIYYYFSMIDCLIIVNDIHY